jgi:hypothetical protein
MLGAVFAYLFWHAPAEGAGGDGYVERLAAFHRALAGAPPPGFRGSWSVELDRPPWDGAPHVRFEDWYLVEDWAALGALNDAAVTAPRRAPHDAVAGLAGEGRGGVYALHRGEVGGPAAWAGWVVKPRGAPYPEFEARLADAAAGGAVVRRQMVLGPAPEYAVLADGPRTLPWPATATGPRPVEDR